MPKAYSTKQLESAFGATVRNRFPLYKGEVIAILLKEKFEDKTAVLSRELRPNLEILLNQAASAPLFTWTETPRQGWQYRGHYRLIDIEPRTNRMLKLTFELDPLRVLPDSETGLLDANIATYHSLNRGNQLGNRVLSLSQLNDIVEFSHSDYDGLFDSSYGRIVRIRTEIELEPNTPSITFTLTDEQLNRTELRVERYQWNQVPIFVRIGYNLWRFIGIYDFQSLDEEAKTITFTLPQRQPRGTDYNTFSNKSNSVIHPRIPSPLGRNAKRRIKTIDNALIALEFAAAYLITYLFFRRHPSFEEALGGTLFLGATIWKKFHPSIAEMVIGRLPDHWYEQKGSTGDYYDF